MGHDENLLKISLDELRMQMLGTQVLFGFQFDALFQKGFEPLSAAERTAVSTGFVCVVATLALLIAASSFYRLTEGRRTITQMRSLANRLAGAALATLALTLACDIFLVASKQFGTVVAGSAACATLLCCAVLWYGLGRIVRTLSGK
jgi:Family of unknown function (DUF6328)